MNKSEFKKVLQGAVMGSHRDLETILGSISQNLRFEVNAGFGISEAGIF